VFGHLVRKASNTNSEAEAVAGISDETTKEMTFISGRFGQFAYFDRQLGSPSWSGKLVMDFGGNAGNLLKDPRCTIEHDNYWCIDISRDAIRNGASDYPEAHFIFYNRYNFEFNPQGIQGLPVPVTRHKYDYILAYSVFTHTTKAEMLELTSELMGMMNEGGALAFTFLDPNHAASRSEPANLRLFLQRRIRLGNGYIEAMLDRAKDATWCTLANHDLYVEHESLKPYRRDEMEGYLTFYTPECIKTIFPGGEVLAPPLRLSIHHCCILRNN